MSNDKTVSATEDTEEKVETPVIVNDTDIPRKYTPFLELLRCARVWLWIPKGIATAFADELLCVEDAGKLVSHECVVIDVCVQHVDANAAVVRRGPIRQTQLCPTLLRRRLRGLRD